MGEKEEILKAVDDAFKKLDQKFDKLHQSQIKLEGMRSDFKLVAETVTQLSTDVSYLKNRFATWDEGEGTNETSLPVRVSHLEMRVTHLEKKKRT